jgi:hypothetical protein
MIRRPFKKHWLLISQPAHAALAGALAAQWGNDAFAPPEPRASVLLAAAEHDCGWVEWEAAPGLNARGEPAHFTEMDVEEHLSIWRRGVGRMTAQDRYAALLVSLHATGLYRGGLDGAQDTPEARRQVEAFLAEQAALQKQIRRDLRDDPACGEAVQEAALMHNARLIQVWDYLSLVLCCGHPETQVLGAAPGRSVGDRADLALHPRDDLTLWLKPYPFRESPLSWTVSGRIVNRGPFADKAAFLEAFRQAPEEKLTFRLERGSAWSGR